MTQVHIYIFVSKLFPKYIFSISNILENILMIFYLKHNVKIIYDIIVKLYDLLSFPSYISVVKLNMVPSKLIIYIIFNILYIIIIIV
jgi:hypothetical protein